jgi:long-subunit fatty acid transport protein
VCVRLTILLAALLLFVIPRGAIAQLGGIDAEFAGAGARPLSMGGSFLGLADDSTAAEFNPAGIRILNRPEIAWQLTHTLDRREEYLPLQSGTSGVHGEDKNEWSTPSFISYVHPGQNLTWALSQLTTIDFVHDFNDSAGRSGELRSLSSHTEGMNNAFGLTFATDIQPRLHVGITVRMNRFHYEFVEKQSVATPFFSETEVTGVREFTDWSPSLNLGILWRATKDWSFGSVYKSRQEVTTGDFRTYLPQTFGVGAAYHPNDRVRLLADVDYITWSDFDSTPSDDFHRNDVTRYHFGGEYLFCLQKEHAWFVRAGVMHESSNALFYSGPLPLLQTGFDQESDKNHVSLGLGLAAETYQIDLGIDQVVDGNTVLILSMIRYF